MPILSSRVDRPKYMPKSRLGFRAGFRPRFRPGFSPKSTRSGRPARVLAWCLAGCLWPWVCAIQAQPAAFACAPLEGSKARQPVYARVAGEARCEGFYQKNVSQPFLEVVSLTHTPPGDWAADGDGRLSLRTGARADLRLQIQPLRSNPLYRADLALAGGATVTWGSSTMLQATGLRLRDIGFLAVAATSTTSTGPAIAEPSAMVLTLAPVSTRAGEASGTAYAVLRPSVAVSALAWRAYRLAPPMATTSALPAAWQDMAGLPLLAWQRIALPIALPADGLGLRVDVRALDSQGQALPLLQFHLLGANDAAR